VTDKGTLLEAVGGESGMAALIDRLYERVLADAKIAAFFAHSDVDELKRHQHDFLTLAIYGVGSYHGRSMREAHAGRGIGDRDFDRLMQHFAEAIEDAGIDGGSSLQIIDRLAALRSEIVGA
jgi:hemoglobin